jgi:ankyrin repeat protein
MYAASAGSEDAVKLMLHKNANPATKDHNGQTALEYATQWKRLDVVQLLEHRNR